MKTKYKNWILDGMIYTAFLFMAVVVGHAVIGISVFFAKVMSWL